MKSVAIQSRNLELYAISSRPARLHSLAKLYRELLKPTKKERMELTPHNLLGHGRRT